MKTLKDFFFLNITTLLFWLNLKSVINFIYIYIKFIRTFITYKFVSY